jgi:hypothetical protein
MHFKMPYPFPEFTTGRNLRMSPIYPRLRQAGAVFGQVMGYERPTYFDTSVDSEAASSAGWFYSVCMWLAFDLRLFRLA